MLKSGKYVPVARITEPKANYDYLATAALFAAEPLTGTTVNVCTTDDVTKDADALVYLIDPEDKLMKTAYPVLLFNCVVTDGSALRCSLLTLTIGNGQGMGEHGEIFDIYLPPSYFDDQSGQYADLFLTEGDLLKSKKHVLLGIVSAPSRADHDMRGKAFRAVILPVK